MPISPVINRSLNPAQFIQTGLLLVLLLSISGCGQVMINSLMKPTIDNLQRQSDPELVCEGAPAFLLMLDSLIVSRPNDSSLLLSATQAYAAYSLALEECGRPQRAGGLAAKAKEYGLALLDGLPTLATARTGSLAEFKQALAGVKQNDVEVLFWGGYGWAVWVCGQHGSPASLISLPKIEQIMLRTLELDERFYYGTAHLFLAGYYGSRPQLLGGKPEKSRYHFERALAISNRQFLPVQVAYAESYARLSLDRDLFDNLLREVIDFPLESRPELTLSNQIAKQRAERLLSEADLYF